MKKLLSKTLCALCVLSLCLSMFSCNGEKDKEKFTKTYFNYFDTVTNVIGYSESKEEFESVCDVIEQRLSEYHKLYDIYNCKDDEKYREAYSGVTNIKDINAVVDGSHRELKVDRKIIDLLLYSKQMYTLTGGETNIAMGGVLKLWHNEREAAKYSAGSAKLPDSQALSDAAKHTDINNLIINEETNTVFISDPEMTLDVGAIAKGYATEMIAKELMDMGVSGYALSVGGNVRIIGDKPDGQNWVTGIENPFPEAYDAYIEKVSVSDKAIVTSGSYQRYYTVDGKKYHHIIDRDTLYPSETFVSVSIISDDSALADALSTALFCMSIEDGKALIESVGGAEALWIFADGKKEYSNGFECYLK